MRGKRSKLYRKLMQQYGLTFGFREPYQVIVDAEIIKDAEGFKMDLVAGLERTLHGKVKPMVTQCSMRHLYTLQPPVPTLIERAKTYERRRCNHHTLESPLSAHDCILSVVDPKGSKTNKHRLVVASQEQEVRQAMRRIPGVPLVYLKRSVMIMEPMAAATEDFQDREERGKFRTGLKRKRGALREVIGQKRVRDENEGADQNGNTEGKYTSKKKRTRRPSGPNPLSVRKPKKRDIAVGHDIGGQSEDSEERAQLDTGALRAPKKRKRKHKSRKIDEATVVEEINSTIVE